MDYHGYDQDHEETIQAIHQMKIQVQAQVLLEVVTRVISAARIVALILQEVSIWKIPTVLRNIIIIKECLLL